MTGNVFIKTIFNGGRLDAGILKQIDKKSWNTKFIKLNTKKLNSNGPYPKLNTFNSSDNSECNNRISSMDFAILECVHALGKSDSTGRNFKKSISTWNLLFKLRRKKNDEIKTAKSMINGASNK